MDDLTARAQRQDLDNRVTAINMSMFEMDFQPESFDLIWAEGSIYIAGFQAGLEQWKSLLKPGGYLVCSEVSWLHHNPPPEIRAFWKEVYPDIDTIPNKINQIIEHHYDYQFSFVLPKEDWTEGYYNPLEANLKTLEQQYSNVSDALEVVTIFRQEIKLYHEYSNDYSYVFYGMIKR
ncbi:class I SAM-dependent methyltransferase [Alkalibacillus salilacus]|uniref:SAM-dependent methyltransferase n=1 Tax=Alkalibacillus salilacus TaxID=284582 RepID=A0ABT9VBI5_9BACI|nr:class I SAM-dependent methyltransferase [Alkalibacillus salilacus]MDQ0158332.1 SAM-dependent methyltransferase [Alkalibacillus salilacus]